MTLREFIERNLLTTVEFLTKHKLIEDERHEISLSAIVSIINTTNRAFYKNYSQLLCEQSKKNPNTIVFCSCCCSKRNFLRNYSLMHSAFIRESPAGSTKHGFNIVAMPGSKMDSFLKYIKAYVLKDIDLAIEVIEEQPLFWDAHLLLIDLCTSFVQINSPLSLYFYAYLKIYKDIDSAEASLVKDEVHCGKASDMTRFVVRDDNILAALHYCYGDDKRALEIFKAIDFTECFDPTFFEFYGILLYNSNDPAFPLLCENMLSFHKGRHETFAVVGLLRLSQDKAAEARDLFKRAYKLSSSPDIACLVAYSYIKLQDYDNASNFYQLALRNSFRILYSIAQGYFLMSKHSICLSYCKKALEIREDGTIYKLMGKVHQGLNNTELAIKYFERSSKLQEHDSLLYLAEIFRNRNDTARVLELYEQYLRVGEKNSKTVAEYLANYYEEQGNFIKMEEYRLIQNKL